MPKKSNKTPSWDSRGGGAAPPLDNKRYDKHYFAHDNRNARRILDPYDGTRLRVSFKTQRPVNKQIRRNLVNLDEDIPMTTTSNNNTRQVTIRERGRGSGSRGRNSPLPSRNFQAGQFIGQMRMRTNRLGESDWYKISIPYGHKYEKDYVIRNLLNYMAPEVFVPITYKVMDNIASFYVDDQKAAIALANCDRKLTMTDGFKLQIKVKPGFPQCEIDEKLKERLKQAMAKRYIADTNALDLSKFHQDQDLVSDYFCALFRPPLLMAVLDIVGQHIPTLEALNLEGNKIHIIQGLNVLSKKFPKLKILYIGDNKIREMNQLDVLKDLKLDELRLQGNPVCKKYRSRQNDYVSDVRKRFPKLLRLDGTELPRPIVFDVVDEAAKAPPPQRMYASSQNAHEIASQFLQQYFTIFDSDTRQPLLNAYNEHACFSLTITYTHLKLNGYLAENRNLFRVNDSTKRIKLLKNGKLPVVSFLSEMPQTKHLLDTFTMDITLPTPTMMFVTLTGYFQEVNTKEEPIRYFNRTFVIIPEGTGYCICNEQIHISQPTDAQLKQLKSQLSQSGQPASLLPRDSVEQQQVSMVPQAVIEQPTPLVPQMPTEVEAAKPMETAELSEEIKQQMVVTLSQQTNMNLQWSLKCLHEVQWNYNNALSAFQNFFKLGQIPPEAFAK
ncbi:PREDICTED: nuclear RNA export factor 1-like [Dinoponera quadriceps]|uniref:Nuclear RNA export factor 1-like n=1 Tax=Dinoponera quadriceps TaxID=609295 RepID=A0A6P3XSI7_DINQU|nr:PREDICTED: nuclear RNA export factor 1-like [Dinoponera quadriceps]